VDGERHQRLWRLLAERAHGDGTEWVRLICEVAVDRLDIDGAAISLRTSGRAQELVAATDLWTRRLEELQYTLGEGPGVAAFTTAGPVLVAELADAGQRWPGFVDSAGTDGLAAVFALPIQGGAIRLGTLDLYRRRTGSLSADDLADAAILADLATAALLADAAPASGAAWTRADAPGHYDDVNVATGMLAAELSITIADAFLRLRAHAFSTGKPLLEVARAVLARQLQADSFQD
jgi:hypothetical protein